MGVRPPRQTFAGRAVAVELDAALGARLRAFARAEGVTLFMLFAAALRAVLARYAGQADVVLGTAIANRDAHELEGLIGMFVNTLALRNELRAGDTFRALLAREKQLVLAAFEHQHTPFELVVDALGVERSPSRTPVFQVMYVHQEAAGEARGQELELAGRTAMFDLAVDSWDRGDRLGVDLVYNTDLFEPALIEQLARHYQRVLDLVTHAPQQRLATLALLAPDEERRALESVTPDLSAGPLIPSLIEAQVDRAPDAAAVTFEGVSLTYRELDARVNRLAHQLLAAGARHDQPIAVCLERSLDLIVAVLAVVKAGAPYLPIDPHAPPRRIRTMLDDSACTLVVDRAWLDAMRDEIAARPPARPAVALDGDHAAYVLFTSGSTGTPKGAVISHASLRNRLVWAHALGFTARDVLLHKTPITFDVSVFELFYPFVIGAHLVVARPDGHRDPAYLTRLIRDQGVTYAHFVPSMFGPFLDAARTAPCPSLRRVICSGEALPAALVRDAAAVLDAELYNLYGPTEATVDVTWWRCGTGARSSTPIGSPVAGVRCYVLDDALQLVPPGVAGELYLAGVQLARGYIGRPTLTSERFVPDPFVPGARMYRTGDLARALPDGALDYLGRTDHQVKLRGFRIELGEIEATLRGDARVRDAAVILREDVPGNPRLVAYVVPAATDLDVSALGAALATTLPDYMVPSAFVAMPALPMTSSGKLDRKALPAPDLTSAEAYVAPRTPTEEALAAIWRGLLAVETVGAHDDFFALGGHSLLAIRVIAQLRDQLGVELPVRAMFEAPRLEDLAARIAALRGTQGGTPALVAGARAARPPLSFAQERLWFLHQLDPDSAAYANRLRAPL